MHDNKNGVHDIDYIYVRRESNKGKFTNPCTGIRFHASRYSSAHKTPTYLPRRRQSRRQRIIVICLFLVSSPFSQLYVCASWLLLVNLYYILLLPFPSAVLLFAGIVVVGSQRPTRRTINHFRQPLRGRDPALLDNADGCSERWVTKGAAPFRFLNCMMSVYQVVDGVGSIKSETQVKREERRRGNGDVTSYQHVYTTRCSTKVESTSSLVDLIVTRERESFARPHFKSSYCNQ